ncbi:uncharacterized protein [Haliotis cracherodii]|uniref:uncharacterized protein n=1 Tax=Haliotis cracherodii TaxID=6455 RepID=UPI0039E7B9F6
MDPDSPRSQKSLSTSSSSEDISRPSSGNKSIDVTSSTVEIRRHSLDDSEDEERGLLTRDENPPETAIEQHSDSPTPPRANNGKTNPGKQETSKTFSAEYGSASQIDSIKEASPNINKDYTSAFGVTMPSLFSPPPFAKVPSTEKSFTTKHGVSIKIYVGDITKVKADAVVTGDSPSSRDMSMVTRSLCSLPGGKEFKDKRETRRVSRGTLQDGHVYTVHTKNDKFPFKYVLQAVVSPYDDRKSRNWLKTLKILYRNVYRKADDKDISHIAIPLLGTGRGRGTAEESVEAAVRTLYRHRPVCLEEVHFVSLDNDINDYFQVICETSCSLSDESSSEDEPDTTEPDVVPVFPSAFATQAGPVSTSHTGPRFTSDPPGLYPSTTYTGPRSTGLYQSRAYTVPRFTPGPPGAYQSGAYTGPRFTSGPPRAYQGRPHTGPPPKPGPGGVYSTTAHASTARSDKKSPPQTLPLTSPVAASPRPKAPVGWVSLLPGQKNEDVPTQTREDRIQKLIKQSHKSTAVSKKDAKDLSFVKSLSMTALPEPVGYPLRDACPLQDLNLTEDDESENRSRVTVSRSDDDSPRHRNQEPVAKFTLLEEEDEEKPKDDELGDTNSKSGDETRLVDFGDEEDFQYPAYNPFNGGTAKYGAFDEAEGGGYRDGEGFYEDSYSDVDDDGEIAAVEFEPSIDENLIQRGNQPPGTMTVATFDHCHVSGFDDVGIIVINYSIPGGKQTEDHPHPGRFYRGVNRRAFLPDNDMGKKVLRMLKIAFDRKLVFTVGRSLTTGQPDVVKWGHIMHKTSQDGGPDEYGYPDPEYLIRAVEDLANLGIVDDTNDAVDDMNSLLDVENAE